MHARFERRQNQLPTPFSNWSHPFPRKVVDAALDCSAHREPFFNDHGNFRRVLDGMHQPMLSARTPVPWTPEKSYAPSPSPSWTCGATGRSSPTPSASRSANRASTSARPIRFTTAPKRAPVPRCDAPVIPLDSMCCASRNPHTRLLAWEDSRMWWYRSASGADALLPTRCRTSTQWIPLVPLWQKAAINSDCGDEMMGLRDSTKAGATSTGPDLASQGRVSTLAPPESGCLAILLLVSRYTSVNFRPENDPGTHTPEPTTAIEPKIKIPKPKAGSQGRG
jgi:hypothetical protein